MHGYLLGGCATLTLEFAQEKKTSCRSVVKEEIVVLYKCYIVGTFQKGSSFFISVIQEPPKSINSSPIFLWKPLTLQLWRSVRHVTLQFLKQQSAFGGSVLRSRGCENCVPNLWIFTPCHVGLGMPYFWFPSIGFLVGISSGFRMTPPGRVTLMALIIQCHHLSALIWLGLLRSSCDLAEIPACFE